MQRPRKMSRMGLMVTLGVAVCSLGCQLNSATQNVQGVQDFQAGRFDKAAERFHYATLENPQNPDAMYNLGATLHQMAYLKSKSARSKEQDDEVRELQIQAESTYNKCLDLNEDHVECHRALGVLLVEMGRSKQAFTLMERWAASSPDLPDPKIELARLYEEHGDDDTALLHLNQALKSGDVNSRTHARAWAAAGLIRERRGELAQAQQNFQQAYTLNRDQPGVGHHLASLNRRRTTDSFQSQSDTRLVQAPEDERDSENSGRY